MEMSKNLCRRDATAPTAEPSELLRGVTAVRNFLEMYPAPDGEFAK